MPDEQGFEEFYAAVFDRLVGQLYLVTGDLQEAEDAVQEALTRAAVRWGRLRDYAVPEAWVRRVAMNLASDSFRRARRRLAVAARLRPEAEHPATLEGLAVAEALRALPLASARWWCSTICSTFPSTGSRPSSACRWGRSSRGWSGPGGALAAQLAPPQDQLGSPGGAPSRG